MKNRPNQSTIYAEVRRDGNNSSSNEMVQSPGKKGVRIMDESTDSQVFQNAYSSRKSPMTLHRTENFYAKPSGRKLTQMSSKITILDQSQLMTSDEMPEMEKNKESDRAPKIGVSIRVIDPKE